ncbi:MAG: complex I subunit 1 family protein [Candidatus Hydrogenedentota bacterium]
MIHVYYGAIYGFVLTAVLGLVASWADRKVTARVHYRTGPPFLQPVYDLGKLFGKETLVPSSGVPAVFVGAPIVGFASAATAAAVLWGNILRPEAGYAGDLIVLLYLLVIPSGCLIVGAFASGNPYASLGASREMKLVMSYELPFVLALLTPVVQSGYSLEIGAIMAWQWEHGAIAASLSGLLALVTALLCIHAKLGLVPFDIPEAETELSGGVLIEYSGPCLALFRLMKHMLMAALPLLLVVLYLGGIQTTVAGFMGAALKFVVLLALIVVIRNTNPRVRTDQALRFLWGPVTGVGIAALILAAFGW